MMSKELSEKGWSSIDLKEACAVVEDIHCQLIHVNLGFPKIMDHRLFGPSQSMCNGRNRNPHYVEAYGCC